MQLTSTITVGDSEAPLYQRDWPRVRDRLPYRKTYRLKPGDAWRGAEETLDQWEHRPAWVAAPYSNLNRRSVPAPAGRGGCARHSAGK